MSALRNSDLGRYEETQMTVFDEWERPICPNNCGVMELLPLTPRPGDVAREAFATCGVCRHQMLVADERPPLRYPPLYTPPLPVATGGSGWEAESRDKAVASLAWRY